MVNAYVFLIKEIKKNKKIEELKCFTIHLELKFAHKRGRINSSSHVFFKEIKGGNMDRIIIVKTQKEGQNDDISIDFYLCFNSL